MPSPKPVRTVASLIGVLVLGVCVFAWWRSGSPPRRVATAPPPAIKPHLAQRSELTPAEVLYGVAPRPDESVTYQPDVIIVGGGPESIRGLSADGLTWTIDARAAHADELKPGKIMFVTGRAIGRVLVLHRNGASLDVLVGPVELTEVIRDCDIHVEQPLDLGEALTYTLPEKMPASIEVEPLDPPAAKPAVYRRDFAAESFLPVADREVTVDNFTVYPVAGSDGIGVHISNNQSGLKLSGDVRLRLNRPRLYLDLRMSGARVVRALVRLEGAAGLSMSFLSGSEGGYRVNINKKVQVPVDFSIPIVGGPVPLSITVRQQFIIKTAFSANGTLEAKGDYTIGGALNAGYDNGRFDITGPGGFAANQSLLQSVNGISLGPAGFALTHQTKVIAGMGAFGFAVGPYVAMNSSMAVYRHADLDTLARCQGAQFVAYIFGGVGYIVPQPVVEAINFILRALNIKPIQGEGGFSGPPGQLTSQFHFKPQSPVCTPKESPGASSPGVAS